MIVMIGTEPWKQLLNQVGSDTTSSAVSSFVSWFPFWILCSVRDGANVGRAWIMARSSLRLLRIYEKPYKY